MALKSMTVRIEEELNDRLENLANETKRTKSFYVLEALTKSIDDIEDIYLAEKRLEDVRAGRSRTFTLEEVEDRLGLDD